MVKTALVAAEFETAEKVLAALDAADLDISVALWLYPPEHEDWRFLLASRRLDVVGISDAYGLVHEALDKGGIPPAQTPPLMIRNMNDPFIRDLRRIFGKAKSVKGMRLGSQTIGNRFVEDAFVYRIQ